MLQLHLLIALRPSSSYLRHCLLTHHPLICACAPERPQRTCACVLTGTCLPLVRAPYGPQCAALCNQCALALRALHMPRTTTLVSLPHHAVSIRSINVSSELGWQVAWPATYCRVLCLVPQSVVPAWCCVRIMTAAADMAQQRRNAQQRRSE